MMEKLKACKLHSVAITSDAENAAKNTAKIKYKFYLEYVQLVKISLS